MARRMKLTVLFCRQTTLTALYFINCTPETILIFPAWNGWERWKVFLQEYEGKMSLLKIIEKISSFRLESFGS